MYEHAALIDRIVNDDRPVTLLVAPAGFGKSVLARALADAVGAAPVAPGAFDGPGWRIRDCACDPDADPASDGPGRLVILCRPGDEPQGLGRARLYGLLRDIEPEALLLPAAHPAWNRSAGWPVLAGAEEIRDRDLSDYLAREVLRPLPAARLEALAGDPGACDTLAPLIPPLRHPGTDAHARLRRLLPQAVETALGLRLLADGPDGLGWTGGALPARPGLALRIIRRALENGDTELAVQLYRGAGGYYLFYGVAPSDFAAFIRAFPPEVLDSDADLVVTRAILALKAGEIDGARRLFADRFGDDMLDLSRALSPASALPLRVQVFRIVLMIYEDVTVSDAALDAALSVIARIPVDTHLLRGSCYNAVLEVFLRQRRYAEAEDVALRAGQAYDRARAPLLRFYIALHRAVIRLLRGESGAALPEIADARACLARLEFDSPGDARIARLVEAAARFEDGDPTAMLSFLDEDLDAFAGGETWPTLAELAVLFGSQAYGEQVSTGAALAYLDRWWVRLAMNRQFRVLLELRKAQVLQNANRWGEAARMLSPIQARIDRVWIESADAEFARLATRDEVMLALCWLRQITYEHPRLPYLGRKLDHMAANPRLTGRQRIALDIWRAHVARATRNPSRVRALLRSVFDDVARNGVLSVLAEEYLFLADLWSDAGTAAYLQAVGPARAVMRRLEDSRFSFGTRTARAHLTKQELKVLMMLTEGASNKVMARQLAISEPTVKFHLKNLYAKLGCNRRADAIRAAKALGWVR